MLVARGLRHDELDVVYEPHVEHGVCLVEDEEPHPVQLYGSPLDVVDQSPRRADDYLGSTPQALELDVYRLSSVDAEYLDTSVRAQLLRLRRDLDGQFPCGGQHEGLHDPAVWVGGLEHREREGRGLAAAGLGLADEVASLQERTYGLRLNREWAGVARRLDAPEEPRVKLNLAELGHCDLWSAGDFRTGSRASLL